MVVLSSIMYLTRRVIYLYIKLLYKHCLSTEYTRNRHGEYSTYEVKTILNRKPLLSSLWFHNIYRNFEFWKLLIFLFLFFCEKSNSLAIYIQIILIWEISILINLGNFTLYITTKNVSLQRATSNEKSFTLGRNI